MARLLRDRYVACDGDRVCDLVTGQYLSVDDLDGQNAEGTAPLAPLVEVLNHGRDGDPRWLIAPVLNGVQAAALTRRAAADALRYGYVPVSVDSYLRLREVLSEDLRERTLLLIGGFTSTLPASRYALIDAATLSPRPHLLLTFEAGRAGRAHEAGGATRPTRLTRPTRPDAAREARAAYAVDARPGRVMTALGPEVERHLARASHAADFIAEGRHAAAERLLRDVAGSLERREAAAEASRVLIALGRLLLERGRLAAAESGFERAAHLAQLAHADEVLFDARLWQAAARTDGGRLTEAESICRAVLATASSSRYRQAWTQAALARVLIWQGRVDEAMALDLAHGREGRGYDELSAWVDSVAVRTLVAGRRIFEAGQRARTALTATEEIGSPIAGAIARTAHLCVLAAAGDLTLAEECLGEVVALSRRAHAPLRVARARLIWCRALRRAGRTRDAQREMERLGRMRRFLPPLLQRAFAEIENIDNAMSSTSSPSASVTRYPTAVALIRIAQEEENDAAAVRQVLEHSAREVHASRVDIISCDAGPASAIASAGAGLPTHLGTRVLEAGIIIGPEVQEGAREIGFPVRFGSQTIAAMVCRWPLDRVPPSSAPDLLALTAALAAPRVDGMLSNSRYAAQTAASIPELVGISAAMIDLRKSIARAAAAPFAVLVEGESGVGKELVARAIHHLGPRRERRFCDINCAALPEELLESELFGHARGSFTGAVADRPGLFEDADGGTLFLDELADLSPRGQAKLLRVLQQQEVRRIGESFGRKVDVRLIAAANREMRSESAQGRFRQDLLYRLDVIRVRIPPLRDRPSDIPILAQHFWRDAVARVRSTATLSHGVVAALARYHWPGNVRELQNVLAALAVAAPARGTVRPSLLPTAIVGATSVTSGRLADARDQFERRFVEAALARAGGNRTQAARELGMSRQGLLKILRRLGMATDTSGSSK